MLTVETINWLVDTVIGVTIVEIGVLLLWRRPTGSGLRARRLLPTLFSGLSLVAALRVAMDAGHHGVIALLIAVSGIAHLVDMRARWHAGTDEDV